MCSQFSIDTQDFQTGKTIDSNYNSIRYANRIDCTEPCEAQRPRTMCLTAASYKSAHVIVLFSWGVVLEKRGRRSVPIGLLLVVTDLIFFLAPNSSPRKQELCRMFLKPLLKRVIHASLPALAGGAEGFQYIRIKPDTRKDFRCVGARSATFGF